ncbi:hypothetical protein M3Y94_00008100 [Aphelenchoides besseyi]|nr:hypothetical protein M3Y94_00008100 [Aphelenchoides besseyi]
MNEEEANNWYTRFKNGNMDISDGASYTDWKVINAGCLLKSRRAITCKKTNANYWMFPTQGMDGRFATVYFDQSFHILDTFHGLEKKIQFDCSEVAFIGAGDRNLMCSAGVCFLSNNRVLGFMKRPSTIERTLIFLGTFDLKDCIVKPTRLADFGVGEKCHIHVNDDILYVLLHTVTGSKFFTINLSGGNFKRDKLIYLPVQIWFSTVWNNKLFGFRSMHGIVNTTEVLEISLSDNSMQVRQIKKENQIEEIHYNDTAHAIINDELFIVQPDADYSCILFKFNFTELKWTKMMQMNWGLVQMSVYGNSFSFQTINWEWNQPAYKYKFGKFQVGKVDLLGNHIWAAMRRYSKSNPRFSSWFTSKLPVNSKYRPLW